MILKNLIQTHHWLSVKLILLELYPGQAGIIDEYEKVYEKLKTMEPEPGGMEIVLTEYNEEDLGESYTYVDVSGRKTIPEPDIITNSYALEFTEWKEWLGMELANETVKNFSQLEIIAHCLYEMTFVDYDEEEIQKQFRQIKNTMEEYKSLSEEEKKRNTISLEELKKRYKK